MAIFVNDKIFVLETKNTHYVFGVDEDGYNRHLHWGKKCPVADYELVTYSDENSNHTSLDRYKQEVTVFGGTMYRECGIKAQFFDKCRELDIEYKGYNIDENTLCVQFADKYYPLEIYLNYKVYDDCDIITRWITVKNVGSENIMFEKLFSAEFTLPSKKPYYIQNTNGAWGGEFLPAKSLLEGGAVTFDSRRGTSGHNNSPYLICYQNADETQGDVFFADLAYSGSFKVKALRDLFGTTRLVLGMNNFDFQFELKPAEAFDTPKVFCGYTKGFGEMSRQMNRFAIEHILPKQFNTKPLPVLYNSWEATGFNVNCEAQTRLAKIAAQIGVELFVMDDGWFGERNGEQAGLGDWFVNPEKFPNGLGELVDNVNELGMDFGLWVEPEMVNPDSKLYREHPDWAYHYEHRNANELRQQLVLNITRKDVQDYIFDSLNSLLNDYNIKYIKWDMNRPLSETGAENLECPQMIWYEHTMAVYAIVDRLKALHPDVQIESCASGGGRSDLGALMHYDQVWTSDNTDAVDRIAIQRGYSLLNPIKTMRAWVTDSNFYNRSATLDFKFNIAMQGALGIGSNLEHFTQEDIEISKRNVELYKKIRDIIQFGELYRILDIDKDEILFNQYVKPDKSVAVAFIASDGTRCFKKAVPFYFLGLDDDKRYSLEWEGNSIVKSGAFLKNVGLHSKIRGEYFNKIIIIKEVQ